MDDSRREQINNHVNQQSIQIYMLKRRLGFKACLLFMEDEYLTLLESSGF